MSLTLFAGCSGGGSGEKPESTVAPASDDPTVAPLEEALDLLDPDALMFVDFSSDRQSAERLELFPDSASNLTELGAQFDSALADVAKTDLAAVGPLAGAVDAMTERGAAFSQLDVRWSLFAASGSVYERKSVTAHRLVDGVSMEDVLADLEDADYSRSGDGEWETFHLDGQLSDHVDVLDGGHVSGRYPQNFFPDVHVHPGLHLVALGDTSILRTTEADQNFVDELGPLLPTDPKAVERYLITVGADLICYQPVNKTTGNRATPNAIRAWRQEFDIPSLGRPVVTTLWWMPGENLVHRSFFADEEDARTARGARERLYNGVSRTTEEAIGVLMPSDGERNESPYEPGWTMSQTANVVEIQHNRTAPAAAIDIYRERGLGFDTCAG